jgi:hypothetical protein
MFETFHKIYEFAGSKKEMLSKSIIFSFISVVRIAEKSLRNDLIHFKPVYFFVLTGKPDIHCPAEPADIEHPYFPF